MPLHWEVASHAGFCFGVKRSVGVVVSLLREGKRLQTLGPVIHNPLVVSQLEKLGAGVVESPEELSAPVAVIRAHGVAPEVLQALRQRGAQVVDTTCPFVSRIHRRAAQAVAEGRDVIIVGEREHSEVKGIQGWCQGHGYVVGDLEDVERLPKLQRALVVAQTTSKKAHFDAVLAKLQEQIADLEVFCSICQTTVFRQEEAAELSKRADVMLVLGGRNSSNTRKLYEICASRCARTYHLQSPDELAQVPLRAQDTIGITAGASTPDEIIKEVVTRMSELDKTMTNPTDQPEQAPVQAEAPSMEEVVEAAEQVKQDANAEPEFASAFEKTLVSIRPGLTVVGTVVQVTEDEVCVNIGYKSDGLVPRAELTTKENPLDAFKIGDEIEVEVVKVNDGEGNVLLSQRNIVNRKVWDSLVEKFENGQYIEGVGKSVVKGGLIVDVEGIRTFVPASQLSERYVEKIDQFVGKPMKLKVIEADKQKRRLVASRKAVLQEESAAKRAAAWEKLETGKIVHGIVRRLTDFGAFVDLGGVDGLIHVTDLSWGRVKHPSEVVKPNQEVDVLVLSLDKERQRISLGLKQTKPKPWETASVNYPTDSIVEGKVVRIVPFGAFVELEPGLDGLVHISQVAKNRIEKVEDVLSVGDIVRVRVLDVNTDQKRISLSIRQAADYGDETELPGGDMELGDLSLDEDLPLDDAAETAETSENTEETNA